jgi:acyl carrier protein
MTQPARNEILELIIETAQIETTPDQAEQLTIMQLEMDSLDLVELSMVIEDRYQLQIDTDLLDSQTTLGMMIDALKPFS